MGNPVADLLVQGFLHYEKGEASLEDVRDNARWLIACSRNGAPFGHYTSIENVCTHVLNTNAVVFERYYVCSNGHHIHHSSDYSTVLSIGVHKYKSIIEWMSTETLHGHTRCEVCGCAVGIKLRFHHDHIPPLLAFSFPESRVHIDTTFNIPIDNYSHTYTLTAVIYYANQHFTAQIVTCDGRLWFYDGMSIVNPINEPTLKPVGSIHSVPNMHVSNGGQAYAIYAKL